MKCVCLCTVFLVIQTSITHHKSCILQVLCELLVSRDYFSTDTATQSWQRTCPRRNETNFIFPRRNELYRCGLFRLVWEPQKRSDELLHVAYRWLLIFRFVLHPWTLNIFWATFLFIFHWHWNTSEQLIWYIRTKAFTIYQRLVKIDVCI